MTTPRTPTIQSIHHRLRSQRLNQNRTIRSRPETRKGRGNEMAESSGCPYEQLDCVYLVVQRRPLSTLPWLVRWLLRAVYFRYRWAASQRDKGDYFSIEYQGVYTSQADAYNAARCDGFSYTAVPLNTLLPAETCHFREHDFPTSEASPLYRQRPVDTVILTDQMLKKLDEGVGRVHQSATASQ